MTDVPLIKYLRRGAQAWNIWRSEQPFFRPDLRGADLAGLSLQQIDFAGADLDGANLAKCSLSGAHLAAASLRETNLECAKLREAAMSDSCLIGARLENADLHSADLNGATLDNASLTHADFESANLSMASLVGADLSDSRLIGAKLNEAKLNDTNFRHALFGARHKTGGLPVEISKPIGKLLADGADIAGLLEYSGKTSLGSVDLSTARNLETIQHDGPSSIGIDTLMHTAKSLYSLEAREQQTGKIEIFLRNAGVHEEALQLFPILLRHPVFYSVFISYSHRDFEFAKTLHDRLEKAGVKVWRDEKDKETGAGISASLKAAIAKHDRVLLLCSRDSLDSRWVRNEIRYATEKEEEFGGRPILIPLLLDGSVEEWTAYEDGLIVDRFAVDFQKVMSDPVAYQHRLNDLVSTLKTFK